LVGVSKEGWAELFLSCFDDRQILSYKIDFTFYLLKSFDRLPIKIPNVLNFSLNKV